MSGTKEAWNRKWLKCQYVSPSEDQYSQLVPSLKTISEMIVAELADCANAIESGLHADGGALRIGLVNR
jgi:hypothetical protein